MSTMLRAKPITAKDFEKFDPEWRYDLIRGELVPMPPPPSEDHGATTSDFAFELTGFVKRNNLGQCYAAETRFLIERDPDTVIAPDWAFVVQERLGERRSKGSVPRVPDAILEVRSPSDRKSEVVKKMRLWIESGVRIGWELDLDARVLTVYRPGKEPYEIGMDGMVTGEDVLPGFEMPLRLLFP
ncbi:MAG TPA: Uma2 family endonuclease [Chthonomonadaceae bacterium]|nr:Uma2 family endonuclease [Chthonomonadaceae bacterium]